MHYFFLGGVFFLISMSSLFAQTKQEIYCSPNIVWAGRVDIDFVPDAVKNENWDVYKVSHLSNEGFQQSSKDLISSNDQTIAELVIGASEGIDFYQSTALKSKIPYQALDLTDPMIEPENFGDPGVPYPANSFNVFRVHCFIYYNKEDLSFHLLPQAIAVLQPQYDVPSEVLGYNVLGWLEVGEWTKIVSSKTWAKRIYRDVAIEDIQVFKQEWTIDVVLEQMLTSIREQARTLSLANAENLDGTLPLVADDIKMLGLEETPTLESEMYEELPLYLPMHPSRFIGLNLSLDWSWNIKSNAIELNYHAFAPIYQDLNILCDDCNQEALQYLFVKVMSEK